MTVRYFEKKCSSLVVKDKYWWFIWCMHGHPSTCTADEARYWPKHVPCSGWLYITPHYSQHVCGKYDCHECMQHANVCCTLIMLLLLNAGHVSLLIMWNYSLIESRRTHSVIPEGLAQWFHAHSVIPEGLKDSLSDSRSMHVIAFGMTTSCVSCVAILVWS